MVYEIAYITIKTGSESQFEAAVAEASPHFKAAKGCLSLDLQRSIEAPQEYRLVVGWQTVANHMVDFRESEGFQAWRTLASPHFAKPPRVEHVSNVLTGF